MLLAAPPLLPPLRQPSWQRLTVDRFPVGELPLRPCSRRHGFYFGPSSGHGHFSRRVPLSLGHRPLHQKHRPQHQHRPNQLPP